MFDFIKDLTEADFDPQTAKKSKPDDSQGRLLYQVPRQMVVEEETKCIVRIALDRDVLRKALKVINQTEETSLPKVTPIMAVELTDPSNGRNFSIRTTSRPTQAIDFTE